MPYAWQLSSRGGCVLVVGPYLAGSLLGSGNSSPYQYRACSAQCVLSSTTQQLDLTSQLCCSVLCHTMAFCPAGAASSTSPWGTTRSQHPSQQQPQQQTWMLAAAAPHAMQRQEEGWEGSQLTWRLQKLLQLLKQHRRQYGRHVPPTRSRLQQLHRWGGVLLICTDRSPSSDT